MEIRDTTDADAECVAALIDGVAREGRYLAGTVGFPVESTRTFIASVRAAGGVQILAVDSGEVIFFIVFKRLQPAPVEDSARDGLNVIADAALRHRKAHRFRAARTFPPPNPLTGQHENKASLRQQQASPTKRKTAVISSTRAPSAPHPLSPGSRCPGRTRTSASPVSCCQRSAS